MVLIANSLLTGLSGLATPVSGDFIYLVDISNTTDDATGTNVKVTLSNLFAQAVTINTDLVDKTTAQTLTNKTLTSPVLTTPQINDTSADHQYIIGVSELTADRTVTLPLLTGNDEFVFKDFTQTLTNKTLTSPTINTPALGANSIDAITEIAAALKSGSDATLITGTAGTSGDLAQWNADGDLVDSLTPPSGVILGTTDTQTLTNKRITKRSGTVTSSATPTINTDNVDIFTITALAVAITSMTTNLSGTPTLGQTLIIRILDNGTARAITWGASFASRGATLPTTTVLSKYLYVGLIYNTTASIWDCVAAVTEA